MLFSATFLAGAFGGCGGGDALDLGDRGGAGGEANDDSSTGGASTGGASTDDGDAGGSGDDGPCGSAGAAGAESEGTCGSGVACSDNFDCAEVCIDGECAVASPGGGPCDEPDDCDASPSECVAGECVGLLTAACSANDECDSGYCGCADAECTSRMCAAPNCECLFDADGDCTASGTPVAAGERPGCAGDRACYQGACLAADTCIAESCINDAPECTKPDVAYDNCAAGKAASVADQCVDDTTKDGAECFVTVLDVVPNCTCEAPL